MQARIKAPQDLRAAEVARAADPPLTADLVFHRQHLVEKVMKTFLTWYDRPYRKTHNLLEIGQQCVAIADTLAIAKRCRRLTRGNPSETGR